MSSQSGPIARRGRQPGLETSTEVRVEEIAATLRNCTFRHGVTLKEFQAKWKLCEQRVHELSSLAAKKVRAEMTDPDAVASKGFAMIAKIAEDAMIDCDPVTGNNAAHRKLALAATAEHMKLSGVAAPTKSLVAVAGDLSALSDEQLEERERAVLARIAARSAK